MKKFLTPLLLAFSVLSLPLMAAFDDEIGSIENLPGAKPNVTCKPFRAEVTYDYVGYSKFKDRPFECNKTRFDQLNANVSAVFYYNPCLIEGAIIEFGYTRENIVWTRNPFYNQEQFNTNNMALTFFTSRLCNWTWAARVALGYDADLRNFTNATAWDTLLWGRYARSEQLGINLGFLAQTGMRIDRVYPIIGFDYTFDKKWKLNAIFPLNISLVYRIDCNWSAALATRVFDSRHRLGPHDLTPSGLITYRATGIEWRMNYHHADWFKATAHVGATLGGQIKVANRQYCHHHREDFKSAGYVGGEMAIDW